MIRHAEKPSPYYIHDDSFEGPDAERLYTEVTPFDGSERTSHMTDETTRELARAMHYAGWRANRAKTSEQRGKWERMHRAHRDRIVMGNHKLIHRAVGRWMPPSRFADDMTGDCQIVMIQAVTAYNPWMGIRFSTYAFTCLMRALSRLSQRHAGDRLSNSLPLDTLPDGGPADLEQDEPPAVRLRRIDEFLHRRHPLLSSREKHVLIRRFALDDRSRAGTLEQVGRELGLSKERVRQVQELALDKLRKALEVG